MADSRAAARRHRSISHYDVASIYKTKRRCELASAPARGSAYVKRTGFGIDGCGGEASPREEPCRQDRLTTSRHSIHSRPKVPYEAFDMEFTARERTAARASRMPLLARRIRRAPRRWCA